MFGRLPQVGQWQRVLIRASQFTIILGILIALTAIFAPQKFDTGVWLLVKQQPQRWIAGLTLWLVLLLYAWTRQAMNVSRVINDVFRHIKQYANDYDVLMRSVLRRNQFTAPEHINTLDEMTRFINAMMEQAIRDQQQLTECTVALGEERLQRNVVERQTSYVRGGVSRVLHDGKDIHNDIIYLLEDIARSRDVAEREKIRRDIVLLQSRLLRIIHLQLSFQPGEVVRKGLDGDTFFDFRQTVVDAYAGRLWRFYDGAGYEALTRSVAVPAQQKIWQWHVQDLCARAENVGTLKGNPHDIWLCIDNMVFNAIDAMSRADQQQLQPLRQFKTPGVNCLPALLLAITRVDDGNRICVSLRNRGPWIPHELLEGNTIWQLRASHSQEGHSHRGRGIGLYCIKQIIDVGYGGDVSIRNVKNVGSVMSLQLHFSDARSADFCLHLSCAEHDNAPLIALGDASVARTAMLPSVVFALDEQDRDSIFTIVQGNVVARSLLAETGETVFIDRADELSPRWYAILKNAELHFYPVDQRGVDVSLLIPANKFSV